MIKTNEKTTLVVVVAFKDENNAPITPISADYRIDDVLTKRQIKDWTPITGLNSSVDIVVTAEENTLFSRKSYEERMLTVRFTYSGDRSGIADTLFTVYNLKFAP